MTKYTANGSASSKRKKPRLVAVDGERTDDAIDVDGPRLNLRGLGEFKERDIDWIWYPYLARGELTIFEGDPGTHKSRVIQAAIAGLVDGGILPSRFRDRQRLISSVVLFDCENDGETSLRRRFRCVGLKRVGSVRIEGNPFQLNIGNVDGIIEQLRPVRPDLIIFDTMNDYFERWADTHKGRDVVQALQPFKRMAKGLNSSVALVRHLRKASGKAIYAGQGSISFIGKARIVVALAKDEQADVPENVDLVRMAISKANEVKDRRALEFKVTDLSTPTKDGEFKFEWGGFVNKSADDILNVPGEPGRPSNERENAKKVLQGILKDGPVEATKVAALAERKSISERTLRRAADELNVIKRFEGRKSYWELGQDGQN